MSDKEVIIIENDHKNDCMIMRASEGIDWTTYIISMAMMLENVLTFRHTGMTVDEVLAEVKIVYLERSGGNKDE